MPEGTATTQEQIVINGQEYSPEDATRYLELGQKYQELEGNLNTSLDKVVPEYTKSTQRVKELEKQYQEAQVRLQDFETKAKTPPPTPNPDRDAIIKAARDNNLVDRDWLNEEKYVKRADLDEYFTEKQNQQKLVENVYKEADKLEKDIDGTDGRVPFDQKAVLAYAAAYNVSDLTEAYNQMNERGNAKWKEAQIAKEERPGLTTLKGGKTPKIPERPKVTDANFSQLWEEQYGSE